jgi:predicted transcriptional regulator
MDIVYAHGKVSGSDIRNELPDPPTRGAMRIMLRTLEDKGHLTHSKQGRMYIYRPTRPKRQVGPPALQRVINTFFGGSIHNAVAAHLARGGDEISDEELRRLADLIREARRKGR